jgi:hypothetical protein
VQGHPIPDGSGELATFSCGAVLHYTGYGPGAGGWLSHWHRDAQVSGPYCQGSHKVVKVEACPGCKRCTLPVRVFYVLVCKLCEPQLPMPFTSPDERGSWAAKHARATGHDSWLVLDQKEDGNGAVTG